MDNYICINGNKTELTPEQLKQLGIELPKASPFMRVNDCDTYYMIDVYGKVLPVSECTDAGDRILYDIANYCTDKSIMEQRALHEILNRLLWRYSMEHDGDKVDWEDGKFKYAIYYYHPENRWKCSSWSNVQYFGSVLFYTKEIGEAAIKEIIEPFMEEHPEFKW